MLKVKVFYSDGREVELAVGPRVRVEVERRFDAAFWELLGADALRAREDVLYFAAYSAATLAEESKLDYDEWLQTIDDVDMWNEEGPENPTQRVAKPARSSPSASPQESPSAN